MSKWSELKCPLLGKNCIEAKCAMWGKFIRRDAKGEPYADDGCTIPNISMILLELLGRQQGTQGAIESLRNEVINGQNKFLAVEREKVDLAQLHLMQGGNGHPGKNS